MMNRLTEGGLTTASKAYRRSPKKKQSLRVKGFADGGEVEETDYLMQGARPQGALNQMATSARPATEGQVEKANSQMDKKSILDNAIKKLQKNMSDPTAIKEVAGAMLGGLQEQNEARRAQLQAQLDPNSEDARWRKAERLFGLSAALAKPQQRGSGFGGFLQNIGEAGTGYAKSMTAERQANQALEREMAGLNFDPKILQTLKETSGLTAPSSNYGKQALDEGFKAGTPEFAKRVKELHQEEVETKRLKVTGAGVGVEGEGGFDRKSGNFITSNGAVIPKIEVTKDREERGKLLDAKQRFSEISKKTIKDAKSFFNVTGSGYTGDFGKGIAGTFAPDTLSAQTKVFTQAIEGIQKALPPGPASDKDVAQARATFPGFSSEKALKEWLKSLEQMVDSHITRQDQKYGSNKWYGAGGTPQPKGERNDLGETPGEQKRMDQQKPGQPPAQAKPANDQKSGGTIAIGDVRGGYRFKGGDPNKQENWEKQ